MKIRMVSATVLLLTSCAPSTRTIHGYGDDQLTVIEYGPDERATYVRGGLPAGSEEAKNQTVFCAEPPADTASARAISFLGQLNLPKVTDALRSSSPETSTGTTTQTHQNIDLAESANSDADKSKIAAAPQGNQAEDEAENPIGTAPDNTIQPSSSEETLRLGLNVANNVVILAQRTELVEVQRHALYRLCELSANNAISKNQVARMSNDILQTLRVLALSTAANKENEQVMLALIEHNLISVPKEGDTLLGYNPITRNLQIGELTAPFISLPQTEAMPLGGTNNLSVSVKSVINCDQVDSVDITRLKMFAENAGIDVTKFPDEPQLRAEIGKFCTAASINAPTP